MSYMLQRMDDMERIMILKRIEAKKKKEENLKKRRCKNKKIKKKENRLNQKRT